MLYLDARATRASLPISEAITAMESAYGDDRETPLRTVLAGSLIMPGRVGEVTGVKFVSTVPGNPAGLVVIFGPDGSPLGIVDGPTLTAIRTGAGSGLATRLLARDDARVLAMLGAGSMASDQVEAVRAVRPIDTILIWSRTRSRAEQLAHRVGGQVELDADAAVAQADIVSCATPATQPLFSPGAVRPGTHINAVGAFTPEMCEVPADTVRQSYIVVEDLEAAAAEAGDVIQANLSPTTTMGDILANRHPDITQSITFFKSVGISSQDIAAAERCIHLARRRGLGIEL